MNCLKYLIPLRNKCNACYKKILYLIDENGIDKEFPNFYLIDTYFLKRLPICVAKLYANYYKYDFLYELDGLIYRDSTHSQREWNMSICPVILEANLKSINTSDDQIEPFVSYKSFEISEILKNYSNDIQLELILQKEYLDLKKNRINSKKLKQWNISHTAMHSIENNLLDSDELSKTNNTELRLDLIEFIKSIFINANLFELKIKIFENLKKKEIVFNLSDILQKSKNEFFNIGLEI